MYPKEQQTSDNLIVRDNCFNIEIFDNAALVVVFFEDVKSFKVTRLGTLAPPKREGHFSIYQQVNLFSWIIIWLV